MAENLLVSAIIPTYNRGRYAAEAVESVLAQTYAPVEVIVVDDGSTDDTVERMRVFGERIRYVRQENGGPSKARNRGIRESRGELVALLDADDTWVPEKLAKQCEYLRQHPEVGLVHSDLYELDDATGERRVRQDPMCREFSGNCYTRIFFGHCVSPSTSVIRRACLERVGLFDESIRGPSFEDQELWLRIAREYPFGYVDEQLTVYRIHETNGSYNERRNLEDEYKGLVKTLKADPGLWDQLDQRRARQKLYDLACFAGQACILDNDREKAREYFQQALKHKPADPRAAACWLYSFVPQETRNSIRRLRAKLVG